MSWWVWIILIFVVSCIVGSIAETSAAGLVTFFGLMTIYLGLSGDYYWEKHEKKTPSIQIDTIYTNNVGYENSYNRLDTTYILKFPKRTIEADWVRVDTTFTTMNGITDTLYNVKYIRDY